MRSLERTLPTEAVPESTVPQQHELPRYLDWRKARQQARAARPCPDCGQKVSGNKIRCFACWQRASAPAQLQEAA